MSGFAWLRRFTGGLILAIALLWAPGSARASEGEPQGFRIEQASSQITVGRVELRYEPHLAGEARFLIEHIPAWWSGIEGPLARDVDDALQITLVDHAGRVAEASGMPHWVAGVARSQTGEIVIARHGPDGARTDLEELLKHEMAHVVLHRATGGVPLPRWLHEGVAESATGGISFARAETLAAAVFGPGVPDFAGLERQFRGADGSGAAVAYAAARDFVQYLRGLDSDGASMRQLLAELRRGQPLESAFVRAYGVGLTELAGRWRGGLAGRFVWYPLLASGGMPVAVLMPLLAAAWWRRRKVLRAGWERLEREDQLPSPPFSGMPATA